MLVLAGLNHRSAPLALRERLALAEAAVPAVLERFLRIESVEEVVLVSTCNRVEVVAWAPAGQPVVGELLALLSRESGVPAEDLARHGYEFEGLAALRHMLQVACGLDSMVVGEPQILGQLRRAYLVAAGVGAAGPNLRRLFPRLLAAARRIRRETGLSRRALSVAHAAVALARKIFGDLRGRAVLVLGSGKMAELAARQFAAHGAAALAVASRTYSHALDLAERIGGTALAWEEALSFLRKADVVVTATGASEPVLRKADVQQAMRARRNRPLFIVDMAVPRDVEESVNDLERVYVYDIDALQGAVDSELEAQRRAAESALRLIEAELQALGRVWQAREVVPTIVALRDRLHDVGRKELERLRHKLGPLSPHQEAAVRELAYAIIQKVLHRPVRHLKSAAANGSLEDLERLYREIFDLSPRVAEEGTGASRAGGTGRGLSGDGLAR